MSVDSEASTAISNNRERKRHSSADIPAHIKMKTITEVSQLIAQIM